MQHLSNGLQPNDAGPDGGTERDRAILHYIRKSIRATWPWTRLLSVLGFIGTGLMILVGLGLMVGESFIPVSEKAPPLVFMGVLYVLSSIFYLVPSIWLSKFSSAASAFLRSGDAIELGKAIAYQKSFWKFIGILALVSIALTVLGVITAILIPTLISVRG